MPLLPLFLLCITPFTGKLTSSHQFDFEDAMIDTVQAAFKEGKLTSVDLVEHYVRQVEILNPVLHAVIELNPDAIKQAEHADSERRTGCRRCRGLHGIPVLLKDNIATKDGLNTTAGSFALLGSVVPRDAGVVRKLRRAGAVILGKASMSEWAHFRSFDAPNGWSARGGQARNPYGLLADPCGSSTGSAIAVAANMVTVSLGTETDGSIVCPSAANSVVGIKPTVGLTSRAGVIPISPRQDTIGPICRTVTDAVHVLDAIVGFDERDAEATRAALGYIPRGGYKQFLKADGLKGKRLGILRKRFFEFPNGSVEGRIYEENFNTMRKEGAVLIDDLEIANISVILSQSDELEALLPEFKTSLNAYLSDLLQSPIRTLLDAIVFNNKHNTTENLASINQDVFLLAQNTSGLGPAEQRAIARLAQLSEEGMEKLMKEKQLDAILAPNADASSVFAIGGYPAISVPAGYGEAGVPLGLCFGGLRGSEPKLIEMAFAFEQATKVRRPPPLDIGKHTLLDL